MPGWLHVLVVDDDPVTREVVRAVLEREGHRVATHHTAFGTAALVRKGRFDVVLLDVEMPGLKGDSIVDLLIDATRDQLRPTILLHSGKDHAVLDAMATTAGADGAITKTSDPRAFMAAFRQLTGS